MGNEIGLQYIMDGNGNYYTVSGDDQLVVANSREEAAVFTVIEARKRIGSGMKAKFYHMVTVSDRVEMENQILYEKTENAEDSFSAKEFPKQEKADLNTIYEIDWLKYLQHFTYLVSSIKDYQDELIKQESETDQEICDLLHLVELYDLSEEESMDAMKRIKTARMDRRDIKDQLMCLDYFQKSIGTTANRTKAFTAIKQIEKMSKRVYHPRQLPEIFCGMDERKTDRNAYAEDNMRSYDSEPADENLNDTMGGYQEMNYSETIFDGRKNDWIGFARQQMEFYQNVRQYMVNLQLVMEEIDQDIEEILKNIEDANYNVAQGYKVFKKLKDLRNEKKEKEKELEILRAMTDYIDCEAMSEICAENMDIINEMTGRKNTPDMQEEYQQELA